MLNKMLTTITAIITIKTFNNPWGWLHARPSGSEARLRLLGCSEAAISQGSLDRSSTGLCSVRGSWHKNPQNRAPMFCHCCSMKLVHLVAGGPTGTGATSTTYSGTSSFETSRTTCGVYANRSISGPLAIWLYRAGEHPPDSGKQAAAVEPGWWQPLGLQQWKLVHTIESGWIAAEGAADPPCANQETPLSTCWSLRPGLTRNLNRPSIGPYIPFPPASTKFVAGTFVATCRCDHNRARFVMTIGP